MTRLPFLQPNMFMLSTTIQPFHMYRSFVSRARPDLKSWG